MEIIEYINEIESSKITEYTESFFGIRGKLLLHNASNDETSEELLATIFSPSQIAGIEGTRRFAATLLEMCDFLEKKADSISGVGESPIIRIGAGKIWFSTGKEAEKSE